MYDNLPFLRKKTTFTQASLFIFGLLYVTALVGQNFLCLIQGESSSQLS